MVLNLICRRLHMLQTLDKSAQIIGIVSRGYSSELYLPPTSFEFGEFLINVEVFQQKRCYNLAPPAFPYEYLGLVGFAQSF